MKQDKKMTKYPEFVLIFMTMILSAGCTMNGGTPLSVHSSQAIVSETSSQNQTSSEPDAYCEIQEFNRTIIQDYTLVPLTEEDLKPYPVFDQYFESAKNDTEVWRNDGTRPIAYFDCNESTAIRFFSLSRKYEEVPNQPIFEYTGHYYKVSFNSYIWHSRTAEPTPSSTWHGLNQWEHYRQLLI